MDDPVEAGERPPEGTVKGATSALLELLGTRVELLGVEVREETRHVQRMLVRTVLAAFLAGSALVMAGVFVVVALWDTHRLLALGAVTLVYGAAGAVLLMGVRSALRERPTPFGATVGEFQSDLAVLRGRVAEDR